MGIRMNFPCWPFAINIVTFWIFKPCERFTITNWPIFSIRPSSLIALGFLSSNSAQDEKIHQDLRFPSYYLLLYRKMLYLTYFVHTNKQVMYSQVFISIYDSTVLSFIFKLKLFVNRDSATSRADSSALWKLFLLPLHGPSLGTAIFKNSLITRSSYLLLIEYQLQFQL
jgi:hypothetical protein